MGINYPKVERVAVDGFLKVYNRGGLHLLFDNTSRQAMQDFANIVLKSFVDDSVAKIKAAQKPKPVIEGELATKLPVSKSTIILTD